MKSFTWLYQHKILAGTIVGSILLCIWALVIFPPVIQEEGELKWALWTGFGEDKLVKIEKTTDEKITKIVEESMSPKTFWDWLNALIIPSSIAIGGYLFQLQQKDQADANLREQALQSYLDALSTILLDEKWNTDEQHPSIKEAGLDIIKARTLSLVRMFSEDKVRLVSLIRFLSDANLPINEILYFQGENLSFTDLNGINMTKVRLMNFQLNNTSLERANLKQADLRGSNLRKASLAAADLRQAKLGTKNCQSSNPLTLMVENKAKYPVIKPVDLRGTNLREAHLGGASLTCADLRTADLVYANLCGTDLRGANLQGAKLKKCLYSKKTLFPKGFTDREEMYLIEPDTDLPKVDLQDLLLMDVDLQRANLQGVQLQRANLQGAQLQGADLRNANLEEADLQNVDLQRTNFQDANLQGTNLRGAKNLTAEQVQSAKNWEFAHYDPEFCKQLGLSTETYSSV